MDNLKRNLDGVFETPKKATMIGPGGDRIAVEVESPQAKQLFSKGYKLETTAPVNPSTVKGLPSGSVDTTQSNPTTDAYQSLMMDSLKQAQGVDTLELQKRQRELQRKAIAARTAGAPEGFETMSPAQRNSIRNSNISMIEGDIDENAYQLAKAEKAIANFENIFAQSQKFGQEFADKMAIPEKMIENYKIAIESNPDEISTLLSTLNDKSKQAVIDSLDWNKISAKKAADKIKPSSGGGSIEPKLTAEEKLFQADLNSALDELAASAGDGSKGSDKWGEIWNFMHNRYGTPPEILDQLLKKDTFFPR